MLSVGTTALMAGNRWPLNEVVARWAVWNNFRVGRHTASDARHFDSVFEARVLDIATEANLTTRAAMAAMTKGA